MISEKNVAADFASFWSECLPLLTPSFIRVFNEAYAENLADIVHGKFRQIQVGTNVTKHDLVAEFSFCLAELSHNARATIGELRSDEKSISMAYEKAVGFLKRYRDEEGEFALNLDEIEESFVIAKQYPRLFEYLKEQEITFRPKIRGAGFLGVCTADLSVGNTLYEVKTISRNLAGKDIKQLLVYLALQSSSGIRHWENAGFFNPRRALHYKFSVDHLLYRTSGGRSTTEVFQDIVDFLSSRDVEVDAIF